MGASSFNHVAKEYDILIEFQGEQHFEPKTKNRMFGSENAYEEYLKIKANDEIKLKWCGYNNKKLILIHYKNIGNIENYLEDKIKQTPKIGAC